MNPSAIRYYERAGLLSLPPRSSGRREYDAHTVERLKLIQAAQQFGFRLNEIREMLKVTHGGEPRRDWRVWVASKVQGISAHMMQMKRARSLLMRTLECACDDLSACGKMCEWVDGAAAIKVSLEQIAQRNKR